MELFFFFSRILFEYHSEDLSDFVIDKINTSVSTLISQLVSTPVHTNAYRRAAASACEFLHVRGGINNVERTLCMGLLEGQLVNREETSTPERGYDTTVLAKLKGQVYRMVVDSSWVPGDSGVDDGTIRWLVSQALHDVEQLCDDEIPITIENTELFPACTARVLVSLRQTTCKPQHKERARDGLVAVDLISWGLYYFRNESFSSAILQRVESLRKAWGNGVASKWNTFLLLFRFLSRLLEYAADDEDDGVALVAIFSNAIALWLKSAQTELGDPQLPLDMEILIAKVGGRALALIHQVDQYTSQVTFAAAQNKNTERDNVVSVLLMSEAHTCSRGQSSTLPLATSFMADLLRRSGFCGKPCPPITLALFIGYLHLLESITFDLESILQALSAVLISPIAAPIDRLTLSLLQVFVGQVKNVMLGRTTNGDFWNDFEVILIRHTLSPRTHITTTNANEVQAELIYDCLETLKRSASPEQLVRLQLTCAHPLRKSTLHQAVHFSVSQAFGKLWLSCVMGVEARYHDVLRIPLQCIARQMDSATTYPCREAWNAVAAHLVTASLDTMLGSIDEIYTILQAKAPAVLTKAPRKEGETSNRRDGQAEAADGEDWEGQESILSGGKGKGEPTVTSDIASKVMMLDLLDGALCLTHQSSATDAKEKEKSRKILEAIVSAIPQVETMPELVGPAIQLMREVLEKFGWTMVDSNNPKQPKVPFLLPHKSQIVASLKSLLQLSLLHIGEACRLFEVFLYCNLADDTTVRRVLRGSFSLFW
ncbi:hypothetical protein AGDE_12691 [Angomonas deanei]|uniref:Uncharacterized protein n=1 Tax=Angomonas deanei TaxID=59799 RepID=A0A7G2C8P8_9TRYP|nr:hypothetical protein AGDE_12691 [Angomonas deanei]CAD2215143.1 hypothetical protein, conserved [Angomonas deanei]|eukprot:EPY24018.1 hypothetical protein AGDE_12691 [Angomonas deanei]